MKNLFIPHSKSERGLTTSLFCFLWRLERSIDIGSGIKANAGRRLAFAFQHPDYGRN
jgi:hypothetical protein